MFTVDHLDSQQFPPDGPESAIVGSGLLRRNGMMVIGGPPKSMKSMLSMSMALELACGRALWGATTRSKDGLVATFPVFKPQRVLIIEQEVGYETCQERLRPMLQSLTPQERQLVGPNVLVESCNRSLKLDKTDGTREIDKIIAMARPDVVVFDPMVEFHTSDENSVQGMSEFFKNLDLLRARYKFGTLLTHHSSKPGRNMDIMDEETPDALRGSSRLFGKVDTTLMISPQRQKLGHLIIQLRLRRGRPIDPFVIDVDTDTLMARFSYWMGGARGMGSKPASDFAM